MAPSPVRVSVILPTSNRAAELRTTLEALLAVDRTGLEVELLVVDNASTDGTQAVIEELAARGPIRYLHEPRPGKNRALNRALAEPDLGQLVVFTDDDVTPREDWLVAIAAVSERWPEYRVFGGRTQVVWPGQGPPGWATSKEVLGWGFACNEDIGDTEGPFPSGRYPVGINYWVRREVLEGGLRFDEELGPSPKNRILGDETRFQMELEAAGHPSLYAGGVVVGHRVQAAMVTPAGIRRRAFHVGRSSAHLSGLTEPELLHDRPLYWRLRRVCSLARYLLSYGLAFALPGRDRRVLSSVSAMRGLACNLEMLRLAGRRGSG